MAIFSVLKRALIVVCFWFEATRLLRVKNVNALGGYHINASIVIKQVFLCGSGVTLENGVESQSSEFQQKHQDFNAPCGTMDKNV